MEKELEQIKKLQNKEVFLNLSNIFNLDIKKHTIVIIKALKTSQKTCCFINKVERTIKVK